jgi:hypothetical protein
MRETDQPLGCQRSTCSTPSSRETILYSLARLVRVGGWPIQRRAPSAARPAATKPERRPLVGGRQGYNPWPRLLIARLNASAPVSERFARDHDGASASVPCLLRQQAVETQMHADKKG